MTKSRKSPQRKFQELVDVAKRDGLVPPFTIWVAPEQFSAIRKAFTIHPKERAILFNGGITLRPFQILDKDGGVVA